MNSHRGDGRILHFINFSKEIYIRCNLAPLHILNKKFIPDIVTNLLENERVSYTRKGDLTTRGQTKLKFAKLSAAVGNFREEEEENFHGLLGAFQ